jgi:hypothetical protein
VSYELEEDRSRAGDRFRPTGYMERVSVLLEREVEARSKNWIEQNATGKADHIRSALDVLVDEGFVLREDTARGHYFTSIRPYREADDQGDDDSEETSSLPRPHLVPSLRSTPSRDLVPSSPLYGDEVEVEVDQGRTPRPDLVPILTAVGEVVTPDLPPDAPEWERAYWARRTEGEVA